MIRRTKTSQTLIHVNQHVIKANAKNGTNNPPLSVRRGGDVKRYHEVIVFSLTGEEVGKFVYRPGKPLSCGAKVWFEMKELA